MSLIRTVARNIKVRRLEARMTQQQLADKVGVDVRYISRLENNPQNLKLDKVEKIAKVLSVSAATLVSTKKSAEVDVKDSFVLDEILRLTEILKAKSRH